MASMGAAGVACDFDLTNRAELTVRVLPPPRLAQLLVLVSSSGAFMGDDAQLRAASLIVRCGLWAKVGPHPDDAAPPSTAGSLAEMYGAELATGARYLVAYGGGDDAMSTKLCHCAHGIGVTIAHNGTSPSRIRIRLELGADSSNVKGHDAFAGAAFAAFIASCVSLDVALEATVNRGIPAAIGAAASTLPAAWTWLRDVNSVLLHKRLEAKGAPVDSMTLGPRVMVCSSARGVGKTTACKALANMAVRAKFHPLVISASLDGALGPAPPGFISAAVLQHQIGIEDGCRFVPSVSVMVPFGSFDAQTSTSAERLFPPTPSQLLTSKEGTRAFMAALNALMAVADQRALNHARCRCAGVILDAPPDDGSTGYVELLVDMIKTVGIDSVLFVGGGALLRTRLRSAMLRELIQSSTTDDPATALADAASTSKKLLASAHTSAVCPGTKELVQLLQMPPLPGATRMPQLTDADRLVCNSLPAWRSIFFGTPVSRTTPALLPVPLKSIALMKVEVRSDDKLHGLLPMDDATGGPSGPEVRASMLHSLGDLVEAASPNGLASSGTIDAATDALKGCVLALSSIQQEGGSILDRVDDLLGVAGYAIITRVFVDTDGDTKLELLLPNPDMSPVAGSDRVVALVTHQRVGLSRPS